MNKLLLIIGLLISTRYTSASEFSEASDRYIKASHQTAESMAKALFTNSLIEAYSSSRNVAILNSPELENSKNQVQQILNDLVQKIVKSEAQENLWDDAFNKALLQDLYQLKNDLTKAVSNIEAKRSYDVHQNILAQKSTESALSIAVEQCKKGMTVAPLNAQQSMPTLLKNTFNIQIQYTYNTDSNNGSVGGMITPEAPRGRPEVNAALTAGIISAASMGGPVGWAVAAGLASVQYLYNSEEKRKADIEMTDALMRAIDNQASSEDVRRYYKNTCTKYLPSFEKILNGTAKKDVSTLEQIKSDFSKRQVKNIEEFKKISVSKDEKALGDFLTKKLSLDDLVDLTMIAVIDSVKEGQSVFTRITFDQTGLSYYEDMLNVLDGQIRKVQEVSYQISLISQDRDILNKLKYNSQISTEINDLLLEWNKVFAESLIQIFNQMSINKSKNSARLWLKKFNDFKIRYPLLKVSALEKRSTLLIKGME
ncbi:MAG: hypothetical protein HUU57_04950 [Bdellovibrio sp.]|nr:hypothetical protein [Bdellovibrio sp.]